VAESESEAVENAKQILATKGVKVAFISTKMEKSASAPQDCPVTCRNCKWLSVPTGYSVMSSFCKEEMPFCSSPKDGTMGVGFHSAWTRECVAYDQIADIKQRTDMVAPKGGKPADAPKSMMERRSAKEEEGWATPEVAMHVRECDGKHWKAGEKDATHDWCGLWDTAITNLVKVHGSWLPRSLAFQSSESQGEGGPNQFGFADQEK
jgi:hypothetical protein